MKREWGKVIITKGFRLLQIEALIHAGIWKSGVRG
jgi:hypothetical protein